MSRNKIATRSPSHSADVRLIQQIRPHDGAVDAANLHAQRLGEYAFAGDHPVKARAGATYGTIYLDTACSDGHNPFGSRPKWVR